MIENYIFFQIVTALFGYGLSLLSDNVYVMTGSSVSGLSQLWLAAFLPCSAIVIMVVSYFSYYSMFQMENLYANLHVHGLEILIASIVST